MPASITGSLTTTGSVTLAKPATDTLAQFQASGTYGSVTFVFEGSVDGTNYFPLVAALRSTGAVTSGTVAPADNATLLYDVPCPGVVDVRLRATAVGSGTLAVLGQSGSYVGTPALGSYSNGGTFSGVTLAGTTTFSGDTVGLFTTASADGAITAKSGTVYVTKSGVCAMTLADPIATTDDGKVLKVISTTASAHTLSNAAGSGFNVGGSATDVGTFGGAKGDGIEFTAYQGKWYVITKTNVTLG